MSSADSALAGAMQGMAAESGRTFGAEKEDDKEDQGINELFKVNQIYYKMLPTLSLVAKRTFLVNNAQKTSYTGTDDTITFNFNTGEFYVSPVTSYWYIQAGYNNPDTYVYAKALLTQGNFMSLCEEISFTTASGTETCRELNVGLYRATTYRWKNTQEYINTIGQIQGASYGSYSALFDGVAPIPDTVRNYTNTIQASYWAIGGTSAMVLPRSGPGAMSFFGHAAHDLSVKNTSVYSQPAPPLREFIIPLDQVLGFFKPYMSTLLPAGALSGGRLDIRLKNPLEALQFIDALVVSNSVPTDNPPNTSDGLTALVNAARSGFTIAKTYIVLDAFQLQDNVLKRLNQLSGGRNGLNMIYDTYDYVITPFAGVGSVECQVQQARSRIIRSFCVVRDTQLITNPYVNSLAAESLSTRYCGSSSYSGALNSFQPIPYTDYKCGAGGGVSYITGTVSTSQGAPSPDNLNNAVAAMTQNVFTVRPPLKWNPPNFVPQQTVTSYQAVLGALYFPQQPFTTIPELYQNALFMFGKGVPNPDVTCSVSYQDFIGGAGYNLLGIGTAAPNATPPGNYYAVNTPVNPTQATAWANWIAPYGCAVLGFLAEKSQALQLSGLPVSNARLLRHRITFGTASASGYRQIATFTDFTRVMKVFLGGRVVIRE